jgi:hypothetical protein
MFGLMVLGAAALYLGLMFFVVRWAWRRGRANGGSMLRASMFGVMGFLLVYLPVFWNHIPVLLAHRSMCAKDAGFTAYVTPEQWIAQNKERLLALKGTNLWSSKPIDHPPRGYNADSFFGDLLQAERKEERLTRFGILFIRYEGNDRDISSGSLISTEVDYWAGNPEDIRLWLYRRSCTSPTEKSLADQRQAFIVKLMEGIK